MTTRRLLLGLLVLIASGCASGNPSAGHSLPRRSDPLEIGLAYGDTLSFFSPGQLSAALGDAEYVGASWIRVDLDWDDVEPVPGEYDWSRFDAIVKAARARHLSVLALLAYTPTFARPADCTGSDKCAPANPVGFAAFARRAVARYAPMGVRTWEIWNEPNSAKFWQPEPQPNRYALLVRDTAAAIRAVQPGATIVLGSLAAGSTASYLSPARQFLQELCNLGVNHLVNAIGWHPYSFPLLPSSKDPHNPWNFIAAEAPSFESILARAGTPHMPIWITEYGAPTAGPGPAATGPQHATGVFDTHVTESFQALLAQVAVSTADADPRVAAFFWYSDDDLPGAAGDTAAGSFGLRQTNGAPKPALGALRASVASIRS